MFPDMARLTRSILNIHSPDSHFRVDANIPSYALFSLQSQSSLRKILRQFKNLPLQYIIKYSLTTLLNQWGLFEATEALLESTINLLVPFLCLWYLRCYPGGFRVWVDFSNFLWGSSRRIYTCSLKWKCTHFEKPWLLLRFDIFLKGNVISPPCWRQIFH